MTEVPTTDLHHLSDRLGATATDGDATIYDTGGAAAIAKVTLDAGEMWGLVTYWLDGYCPICSDPVNQGHHLCRDCAANEARLWQGY